MLDSVALCVYVFVSSSIAESDQGILWNVQIGDVPTPWPSWLIAAHPTRTRASDVTQFLKSLSGYVWSFSSPEQRAGPSVEFIKEKFGYPEEDVKVT
jgi:hypothetical protein